MSDKDYYSAFETSPVPPAGYDTPAPEPYRGIYAMPTFVTIPTPDLAASVDFWVNGLGFIDLFSVPGQITHLRRWVFQDVLLVPGGGGEKTPTPPLSVTFACVLGQIDGIVRDCEARLPGSTEGPRDTPWNTLDVEVITPENVRVILTAAKPYDLASDEARSLAEVGIMHPDMDPDA